MLTTVAVHIIVKHLTADILSQEVNSANKLRFYGVMVSTLDFESSDPSSNLGRTSHSFKQSAFGLVFYFQCKDGLTRGRGRDSSVGRALD